MNRSSNELTRLTDCYEQINDRLTPEQFDNQLIKLNNIVLFLTGHAIQKSKNLIGQEDKSLVAAANTIRNLTVHSINIYKGVKINSKMLESNVNLQNEYQRKINNLIILLNRESKNISVNHITISKKEAQRILANIISFLSNYLLNDAEKQLIDLQNQGQYVQQKEFIRGW